MLKFSFMESASKQSTPLEIWLHDVQSYIYKRTYPAMTHAGFNFHRTSFSYKRKNKKSTNELSFIFLSKVPVNYRVSFILEIAHPPIRHIKHSFMEDILQKESNLCSVVLNLKDFPLHDPQTERVKDYSVYNYRDLFIAGDLLSDLLMYELVPLCGQMSSVGNMDAFFENNPEWSLNTNSGGNICTDLIVSKLNRRRDFELRYRQLREGIQQRIGQHVMSPESRQLLSLCYDALKK